MKREQRMQAILDEAQTKALIVPNARDEVVAYANACVNSGAGALQAHYKGDEAMADVAIFGWLSLWVATVERRIQAREAAE